MEVRIKDSITSIRVTFDINDVLQLLKPSRRFIENSFDNFQLDPKFPSQEIAKDQAILFAQSIVNSDLGQLRYHKWQWHSHQRKIHGDIAKTSLYIDGTFGVGKTHLLAAIYNEISDEKVFVSFVNLVNIVGALGLEATVQHLSKVRLVAIDEFELDDPGETVLISTLLERLSENPMSIIATSNTTPTKLGIGRFSSTDFMREIQGLGARFEVIHLEGLDHRTILARRLGIVVEDGYILNKLASISQRVSFDPFDVVNDCLSNIHPVMYQKLILNFDAIVISFREPIDSLFSALRFVVLVDRAYEMEKPLLTVGLKIDEIFAVDLLRGGFAMKFGRCISRLFQLRIEANELFGMGTM